VETDRGFVIYADGSEHIKQAYLAALTIKYKNKQPVSLITTENNFISQKILKLFENVIVIDAMPENRYHTLNRARIYDYTPYRATIVLDSDTLMLDNLNNVWNFIDTYDFYYPMSVYDYRGEKIINCVYRKAFMANKLPNVYSGIHYFKKTDKSEHFFSLINLVANNWKNFYDIFLKEKQPKNPSMDVITAIVFKMLDIKNFNKNFFHFVHMKTKSQGWRYFNGDSWLSNIEFYLDNNFNFFVGNYKQHGIFHYVNNDFLSEDLIAKFESKQ
jgi:hypothetical protein